MPFGPYDDFAACLVDQRRKGHSDESAHKICGALQRDLEKADKPVTDRKPGILTNLRIKRVALVDNGANFDKSTGDGAHIMLYKRDDTQKGGPSLSSVHVDSTD